MITALVFIIVFVLLALGGYLIWAMQQKLEAMAQKFVDLSSKVRAGEEVISENFETIEKRFAKLEHEFKESKGHENGQRRKEVLQAAKALQRQRDE